jgi:hypothetical protein
MNAVLYFVREILPRIRQAEPQVASSLTGRAPTADTWAEAERAG